MHSQPRLPLLRPHQRPPLLLRLRQPHLQHLLHRWQQPLLLQQLLRHQVLLRRLRLRQLLRRQLHQPPLLQLHLLPQLQALLLLRQHRQLRVLLLPPPRVASPLASLVRVTTHSLQHRAWVSHVQSRVQATTHLHLVRAWVVQVRATVRVAQAVRVLVAQAVQVAQVAQVAHHVRALLVRVAQALLVQASAAHAQLVPQAPAHRQLVASLAQVAAVRHVVVATHRVPQVPSVRVARAVHQRPASRSVQSAKNSSREATLLASVVHLFHAAMATPFFAFVVVPASKTSQTRLMPTLVS